MSTFAEGAELAPVSALPDAHIVSSDELSGKPKRKGGIGMTIIIALVALLWISPLVLLVITALRPLSDFIANGPLAWPQEWTLQNFADAWGVGNFATTYRNSAFLLILKVPLGVLISAMLAFALAKLRTSLWCRDHVRGVPGPDDPDLHHDRAGLHPAAQHRRG